MEGPEAVIEATCMTQVQGLAPRPFPTHTLPVCVTFTVTHKNVLGKKPTAPLHTMCSKKI